ncbi:acylneuraminate cytidylyltransferase family protein [Methanobrevibacter sp.]|uniref:acylneuraminate cytidylyltransferase family protein n=1 Tax=Methanobrevibacter sp. TaxID=66852 RepID=UPI0025CD8F0C|nr:acylneuraminate cytidylyltransferase family protein [Methanobrevibacter sp.]MBQ2666256.1 acylneuraminate cytidylyltransferase family protein [Methanobrevibacter sp.]
MNIISIIPARGGSKGIPRKNIKLLNGKPLISYSIEASKSCNLIDSTYVSTEDVEISEISKKYDAEVIERPEELAGDDSSSIDVILHVFDYMENHGSLPDLFILLQPTSPLRTSEDIEASIKLFLDSDCDSLVGVCEMDHRSLLNFSLNNGFLVQNNNESLFNSRRQDFPTYYSLNGAIYITTPDFIRKNRSFYCDKTIPYVMSKERSIDIDTPLDFKLAEIILNEFNDVKL